jgi:hypothetical protein
MKYSISWATAGTSFWENVVYEGRPALRSGQTATTRSRRVEYVDRGGRMVATVHEYVKADGSLAASGKPDPKKLRIGNTIYMVKTRAF